MPPKGAGRGTESVTLTAKNVIVLRKLLCSLDINVNYADFGRVMGLNTPSNGRMVLRSAFAPLGLTIQDGSFHELIADETAAAPNVGVARAAKDCAGGSKRKREDETVEDGSPVKKAKKETAAVVKKEPQEDTEGGDGAGVGAGTGADNSD